nr:hypothetical protein [Gammaproteobacteria bacterium]NIN37175.1 hypothetical protein [Gammaproteobacteria bacterium]NIO26033.1 hypothetical protein [Gammaproteobacteria bacterium]NIO66646.1 hypothetical protein [Gammaproteobacteria bacterium]NIP65799.1 hypothetical protein [Gammaproteobacteria bacterium]
TAVDTADGLTDGTYFTVTTDGTDGTATIDPSSGLWSYTPNADFNGTDSFTVTITDDDGHTATQVITVTVTQVDDAGHLRRRHQRRRRRGRRSHHRRADGQRHRRWHERAELPHRGG